MIGVEEDRLKALACDRDGDASRGACQFLPMPAA